MISKQPNFYLVSSESYAFRDPRKCWVETTVAGELRSDYLLVRIDPPVIDFRTKEPINQVLITGKNKPIKITELPTSVYIAKIKDAAVAESRKCSASNIEVVASGDIFASNEEAAAFAMTAS
ncbi:MAG: hypothetical protein WC708_10000 [Lentisphaeria bacterium]